MGGLLGGAEDGVVGFRGEGAFEASDSQFVGKRASGAEEGWEEEGGLAERVGDGFELFAGPEVGAWLEAAQLEGGVVESALAFGIGGEQDLEAVVEEEALVRVGAEASAEAVRAFEEEEAFAGGLEGDGGVESGEAAADDEGVVFSFRGLGHGWRGGTGRVSAVMVLL